MQSYPGGLKRRNGIYMVTTRGLSLCESNGSESVLGSRGKGLEKKGHDCMQTGDKRSPQLKFP